MSLIIRWRVSLIRGSAPGVTWVGRASASSPSGSLLPKAEQLELHVLSPNFVLGLGPAESPRLIRSILSVLTWN